MICRFWMKSREALSSQWRQSVLACQMSVTSKAAVHVQLTSLPMLLFMLSVLIVNNNSGLGNSLDSHQSDATEQSEQHKQLPERPASQ